MAQPNVIQSITPQAADKAVGEILAHLENGGYRLGKSGKPTLERRRGKVLTIPLAKTGKDVSLVQADAIGKAVATATGMRYNETLYPGKLMTLTAGDFDVHLKMDASPTGLDLLDTRLGRGFSHIKYVKIIAKNQEHTQHLKELHQAFLRRHTWL